MNSQQTQGDKRPHSTRLGQLWAASWGLGIARPPSQGRPTDHCPPGRIPTGHISVPPTAAPHVWMGRWCAQAWWRLRNSPPGAGAWFNEPAFQAGAGLLAALFLKPQAVQGRDSHPLPRCSDLCFPPSPVCVLRPGDSVTGRVSSLRLLPRAAPPTAQHLQPTHRQASAPGPATAVFPQPPTPSLSLTRARLYLTLRSQFSSVKALQSMSVASRKDSWAHP